LFEYLITQTLAVDEVGLTDGGVGMKVDLEDKVTEATLSYTFEFSDDYDWTLGGKLPGLASAGGHARCSTETFQRTK
jgi:hypothetical protein